MGLVFPMLTDADKGAIVKGLATPAKIMAEATKLGRDLANKIDRVYLVGCGAPNCIMLGLEYWLQHYSSMIEVCRYFPAEFVNQNPACLDARTLVLFGSKSGTTLETVEAAEFLAKRPCITLGVTQAREVPLAKAVQHSFLVGETNESHSGMFMIMQAFIGALMAAKNN